MHNQLALVSSTELTITVQGTRENFLVTLGIAATREEGRRRNCEMKRFITNALDQTVLRR
jgi:hypothetical protein